MHLLLPRFRLVLTCIALAGCGTQSDYGKSAAGQLALQSRITVPACTNVLASASVTQTCAFVDASSGTATNATLTLTGMSSEDSVQTVPVAILETPEGASDFVATYDNGRGTGGRVLVTSGLAALPVDSRTSLVAEPGMQLVLLELPGDAGADTYSVTLTMSVASPQLKVLSATKVTATGSTYFAPLLPCAGGFESVPSLPIAANAITSTIDLAAVASAYGGCPAKVYIYTSVPPRAATMTVYEYYNATLDHYFITWVPAEVAALDQGTVRDWQRTGYSFTTYITPEAGTSPVCRYYMPPAYGDSHFFGRGTQECNDTGRRNPGFVLEAPEFMYMTLPSAGTCAPGTQPIYRVFSNRTDANHRYMTDPSVRDAMVAHGWVAEGDGPDLVVMCAPR